MRRRSGANFEELLSKEWSILTKNEQQEIQHLYKRTEQRNGGISFYDMIHLVQGKTKFIKQLDYQWIKQKKMQSIEIFKRNKSESLISMLFSVKLQP